ncbi:MAG: GNAT family N-acetyltransferase [Thaumarchaeota archaeon]|nr:GNAT family N-acetyltransferase [Nitrososphaerota archaeon]
MQVRKASKKDTKPILGLLVQLRPSPSSKSQYNYFMRIIQRYLTDKDKQMLVAVVRSKIVGLASLVFLPRLNQKLELWIPELVVDQKYRKKRVGKSLIKACVSAAKKKKCFRIRLESGNRRKGSHAFYRKIGFEQFALSFQKPI